jgi:KUP system potassium uptake protein
MLILVALFIAQRKGTANVGKFFGPVMIVWFVAMAAGGLWHIQNHPEVLKALAPSYAFSFLYNHGMASMIALGAVFLTVTGAEALYADLGHFGPKPVRMACLALVMPALILNYFGQGALVLATPEAASNPFYLLYPGWAQLPMVILATLATVIASQAVISGAYSMTHQAMHLGILPRLHVKYTSADNIGQIYIPRINWLLMAGVVFLIQVFRSSDALASAYGIAVTGTMLITSSLLLILVRKVWKWSLLKSLLVVSPLLLIELVFLASNLTKIFSGGYIPLIISGIIIFLMRTWVEGNRQLRRQLYVKSNAIETVLETVKHHPVSQVEGTAVYINANAGFAPIALIQNLRHNKIIHEQNILLSLDFASQPYVNDSDRVRMEFIPGTRFTRVLMRFGFMEPPNIMRGLRLLHDHAFDWDSMGTTYFLSHRHIMESSGFGMPVWRDRIFISMTNISAHISDYLHLPFNRVVELSIRVTV